jgi:hypothetical protein
MELFDCKIGREDRLAPPKLFQDGGPGLPTFLPPLMKTTIFLILIAMAFEGPLAWAKESLYPLTLKQALDESTLDPVILEDRTVTSITHPGQRVRWVTVRFFSHDWKDGPWHGTMTVALPPKISKERQGLAAIALSGVGKKGMEPGYDAKRDLAEWTAMEFGIPVATMPLQGTHYGITEIHELSDYLTKKFVETGDPSWLSAYCGAAVRARAVTMIGKLTGHLIHSVVHMGGSISAGQGWVWASLDERVKGLVASGSVGPFTKVYPDRPPRSRLKFLHEAPDEIKDLFAKHRDPISYASKIDCPVLYATGSNDRASPPALISGFLDTFKGPTYLATKPNGQHSPGTQMQAETFRMWVEHVLFDRPLSRLSIEELSYENGALVCGTRVEGMADIKEVNLVYALTENPDFLNTSLARNSSKDNYTQAKWKVVPMIRKGKSWRVRVDVANPKSKYAACIVHLRDAYQDRPGHLTTITRQVPANR